MYALTKNESGEWHNKEIFMCEADVCLNGLIGHYERYVISFGEDEEGENIADWSIINKII